jgi:hypothetical protein
MRSQGQSNIVAGDDTNKMDISVLTRRSSRSERNDVLVRRTIVGRGRRQQRLRRMAAGASPLFQVPPVVEIAARGRVVPGELGGAAVRSAGAGVAKASESRLGVRVAASSFLQHRHAWSVPSAEQAKPCLACHAQRRWRQAGCWSGCDPAMLEVSGARRSTGLSRMRTAMHGNDEAEGQAPERLRNLAGEIVEQARHLLRKPAKQRVGDAGPPAWDQRS